MMVLVGGTRREVRLGEKRQDKAEIRWRLEARGGKYGCRTEKEDADEVERRQLMKEMGGLEASKRSMT
jgi:hypothetical protein